MSQIESIVQNYENPLNWNGYVGQSVNIEANYRFTLYSAYLEEYEQLSNLEKEILTIAKTILKKKKYSSALLVDRIEMTSPIIEKLYNKCVAKLHYSQDISKEEIFATIQVLVRTKWMVSGQRRTRQEIIETPVFRKMLQFIEKHPGTYSRDSAIESELHLTKSPFLKHIEVLDAFNLIRKKKTGNKTTFFLKNVPDTYDNLVVLFSNPDITKTVVAMKAMENINISEIARQLNIFRGTIQYNIKKLLENGVLKKNDKKIEVNTQILSNYNQIYQSPAFF
jgi:predicted transcriptional regulator